MRPSRARTTPTRAGSPATPTVEGGDRRTAGHRFGEDQAEWLARLNRVEQRAGAAEEADLRIEVRLAEVDDLLAVDERLHVIVIIRLFSGREDQAHAEAAGDFNRLDGPFALGESAEKEQIVFGAF